MFKVITRLIVLCGLALSVAHAETIVSVTEIKYDPLMRPMCTAVRMDEATFNRNVPTDACALASTTSSPNGPDRITMTVYDAAGQTIEVKRAVGTGVEQIYATYGYTKNGLKAYEADANGNLTRFAYDGFDRLINVYYPSTSTTHSAQPCGAVPGAFPTSGCGTLQPYTTRNGDAKTPALGAWNSADYETFGYDANNNRTYYRRRNGQELSTCFDALNRTTIAFAHYQSDCPSSGGAADVYTTYDLKGHIKSKRFSSASVLSGVFYAYDALGRVTSTKDANDREITYQYNQASARTQMSPPGNSTLIYANDSLNRLSSVTHSVSGVLFSQAYYSTGERRKLLRGATISPTEDVTTCPSQDNATCYSYDGLGRLASLKNDLSGSNRDISWTFGARNPANQIMSWGADSTVYDYVQLTPRTEDPTYNGLNQDARIAGLTTGCQIAGAGYDCNGNLTNEGVGGRSMTYDVYNRLVSVTGTGSNVLLAYDPEGRLAKYSVNGGTSYTSFLYDGTNLIAEYDGSTLMRSYVHGTGVDEPIVWFEGSDYNTKRYFVQNYQGSVIGYTNASGALQEVYKYGPWGEPLVAANAALPKQVSMSFAGSRFRYTGQTVIPEAKLYYYKARVYDPMYGRFLQTDPIGSKDDLDLYAYVGGDPINGTDSDGLCFDNCPNYYGPVNGRVGNPPSAGGIAVGVIKGVLGTAIEVNSIYTGGPSSFQAATQRAQVDSWFGKPATPNDANGRIVGEGAVIFGSMFIGAGEAKAIDLTSRAREIHGILDPIAKTMRTTAIAETAEGGKFVASSRTLLSPAQRAALQSGEVSARGVGHAEMTAFEAAEAAGQRPIQVFPSRPVCADCAAKLNKKGIRY